MSKREAWNPTKEEWDNFYKLESVRYRPFSGSYNEEKTVAGTDKYGYYEDTVIINHDGSTSLVRLYTDNQDRFCERLTDEECVEIVKNRKKMIFLIGGSCGGKTTTEEYLVSKYNVKPVVSLTTRPPRPNEVDGQHYHFVDMHKFERTPTANCIAIGVDWMYAVPVSEITPVDRDVVYSVIGVEYAMQVAKYVTNYLLGYDPVFVMFDVPKEGRMECMRARGMSEDEIALRLSKEDNITNVRKVVSENGYRYIEYSDELKPHTQEQIGISIFGSEA